MAIADLTQAQLAREMWDRYKSQFKPILEGISSDLISGARLEDALGQVEGRTSQAFDLQQQSQKMRTQRMGLSSTPSAESQRMTEVAKARSQAGAENELRSFYKDMKEAAVLGAGGSINSQITQGIR